MTRNKGGGYFQGKFGLVRLFLYLRLSRHLKKREGVPEMGTKPLKALRGYRASNRGSKKL